MLTMFLKSWVGWDDERNGKIKPGSRNLLMGAVIAHCDDSLQAFFSVTRHSVRYSVESFPRHLFLPPERKPKSIAIRHSIQK